MFLFKKIVAPLFFPMTLIFGILLLGLILILFTRRQRAGKVFVLIGVLLLGVLSYDPVPEMLLRPLEYKYPPVLNPATLQNVKWVVVLGAGHVSNPGLPVTGQLSDQGISRLIEGIRLHRELPGSKLLLSGGKPFEKVANARIMADVALAVGIKREDLVLEEISKDTEEEARFIQRIVGRDRFVLVTEASHMPRSVLLFKRFGMSPIPAPTDYLVKGSHEVSPGVFYPWAENIHKAERAFYEYLGLMWTKVKGP